MKLVDDTCNLNSNGAPDRNPKWRRLISKKKKKTPTFRKFKVQSGFVKSCFKTGLNSDWFGHGLKGRKSYIPTWIFSPKMFILILSIRKYCWFQFFVKSLHHLFKVFLETRTKGWINFPSNHNIPKQILIFLPIPKKKKKNHNTIENRNEFSKKVLSNKEDLTPSFFTRKFRQILS